MKKPFYVYIFFIHSFILLFSTSSPVRSVSHSENYPHFPFLCVLCECFYSSADFSYGNIENWINLYGYNWDIVVRYVCSMSLFRLYSWLCVIYGFYVEMISWFELRGWRMVWDFIRRWWARFWKKIKNFFLKYLWLYENRFLGMSIHFSVILYLLLILMIREVVLDPVGPPWVRLWFAIKSFHQTPHPVCIHTKRLFGSQYQG